MFKSNQTKTVTQNTTDGSINLIGAGTKIEGEISSNGDIRVDGELVGTVTSKAKVVVGPNGFINGEVFCESADISGRVNGTINVQDLLTVKHSALVEGAVNTKRVIIEDGAKLNGNCKMNSTKLKVEKADLSMDNNAQKVAAK